ncbi:MULTISPECIES: DNA adenine methylase [Microcystis]|uniref:DNA adenine methylase n=1 Tax=Microcystis TaxID=1125 RepID=UPI00059F16C3|nr:MULTISPECIES: DNA adenine methylase [Microcystis]
MYSCNSLLVVNEKNVIVPTIKCQGIKTKLVSSIKSLADQQNCDHWIEPFCGSGVVAFNSQPQKALY